MARIYFRSTHTAARAAALLPAIFLLSFILIRCPISCRAQQGEPTAKAIADTVAAKIKSAEGRVTLSVTTSDEKKEISKEIVIGEEGITLNGKTFTCEDLEDTIAKCKMIEGPSIVKFGEAVVVEEDEVVDGDLVSFGGDVTVKGIVTGDVAVIGATLYLKSTGVIKGDVQTIGGAIQQEPGGKIRGQRIGILPETFRVLKPFPVVIKPSKYVTFLGAVLFIKIILSLLLVALAGFFAPRHVERIQQAIVSEPLKSILLGFVTPFIALMLTILLTITVIGIPAAIAVVLGFFLAEVMGLAGVSFFVGSKLCNIVPLNRASPMGKILLGASIIEAALILAWLFTLGGSHFAPLFWLFFLIGWTILLFASTAGLGAAIWTRFGTRPAGMTKFVTPPHPPTAPRSSDERPTDEPTGQ